MSPKAPKNIECQVIKELEVPELQGSSNRLRIVRWIVDGKDTGAVLEKRNFFVTKDGEERMGKAKGFNKKELKYLVDHWSEIESDL